MLLLLLLLLPATTLSRQPGRPLSRLPPSPLLPSSLLPSYIDIFGFQKATTSGKRLGRDLEAAQTAELKNGRLAMIGIASFYSAATLEGSVPALPFPF